MSACTYSFDIWLLVNVTCQEFESASRGFLPTPPFWGRLQHFHLGQCPRQELDSIASYFIMSPFLSPEPILIFAGYTLHRPIQLKCGHAIGMPCLAYWAYCSDSNNRCPLGRGTLYGERERPVLHYELRKILEACLSQSPHLWCNMKGYCSEEQKTMLYGELKTRGSTLTIERPMIFFDAYLEQCRQIRQDKHQAAIEPPERPH